MIIKCIFKSNWPVFKGVIFSALCLSVLSGCTSIHTNGGGKSVELLDHPPIGVESMAFVGDEMLAKGKKTTVNAIQIHDPLVVGGILASYTFSPGIYVQSGFSQHKTFFRPVEPNMVIRSALADPYGGMFLNTKTGVICGVATTGGYVCGDGNFSKTDYTATDLLSFQQTLLYSGKVGNKINISYREFKNGMARQAFSHDVEYDLSSSNIVGYKGAQIEVLNATNSSITYKLIKNFK